MRSATYQCDAFSKSRKAGAPMEITPRSESNARLKFASEISMNRTRLAALVKTVFTCAAVFSIAQSLPAASRPNVIVILSDDQGYGDFSIHGNPVLKTPN